MVMLRRAKPADVLAVAGVHVRSWQVAYRGIFEDDYLDALVPQERAARYHFGEQAPDGPQSVVATDGGVIVGFGTFGPSRDADRLLAGEVYALYVDPPFWGRGIGRALLAEVRSDLARLGFRESILWMLEANVRAERLYRADGWSRDGSHRTEDVWGVMAQVVRLSRPLS